MIKKQQLEQASQQLFSIGDFIRWIYSRFVEANLFYGHGTDNPWDEAVALVLQSLQLAYDFPDSMLNLRITSEEKSLLLERMQSRINHRLPLPYLTNKAYFCDKEFYVDERVIIPRSPIAELIENQFQPWIDSSKVKHLLDMCTGSGCIAIACAEYFPHASVDACDISADCLQVAEINKKRFSQQNVKFYQSDLFDALPDKKYQIIVCNPPYVDAEDYATIPKEFLAEPQLALVSGDDGLELTRKILTQADNFLADGGILIIEVGNSAAALQQAYPQLPFIWLELERGGHGVFLLHKEDLQILA